MDKIDALIEKISAETERIWLDEPDEIRALRLGVFPNGAGTGQQYFSNMVFVNGDMRALSSWITPAVVLETLNDERFSTDQCKDLFAWINVVNVDFLAYCGFVRFAAILHEIVAAYPDIDSKEQFARVVAAWYRYANRMYFWVHQVFPWGLGAAFTRVTEEDVGFMTTAIRSTDIEAHFERYGSGLMEFAAGEASKAEPVQ